MTGFTGALLSQGFMQHAAIAALLAAVGCGVIGSFVVARRISYLAGGIAHSVLGGMGLAYFLGRAPFPGALGAALVAALVIGLVTRRARQHEDIMISAVWAVGMAAGVMFISQTPGYSVDLMSYLFGNVLMVPRSDLYLMGALDAVVLLVVLGFHKQLIAVAFDEEFAGLRGIPVTFFYMLLLCMIALTVVVVVKLVGLILVIALLTLPAAIAGRFVRTLVPMMVLASALAAVLSFGGLALSYGPDWPAGATITLVTGAAYFATLGLPRLRRG
ncbi:MAG TPA: metal ABC transporter permease [Gammaproteobacteria bacterium]|nr:metal ABC transporter permease [Gammaproteobacteria bacterium]